MFLNKRGYVWYSPKTSVTGRLLAQKLGFACGSKQPKHSGFIIGWGCKIEDEYNVPTGKTINNPLAIKRNRNKFASLSSMRNGGVSVPNYSDRSSINELLKMGKIRFPLIGRHRYHQGGFDALLCLNMRDVGNSDSDYFVEYIPNRREFRIHVFNGRVIRRQEKKKNEETEDDYIKSSSNGWIFCEEPFTKPLPAGIDNEAIKAVKAVGLDFGAVDIVFSDYGHPVVLEANSAPSLNEDGLAIYVNEFKKMMPTTIRPKFESFARLKNLFNRGASNGYNL